VLRVGDEIAGYEIVAPLKAGGMAALYLGRRSGAAGFAKHVAIKVVHAHLANDESFVEMFLDEARLSARIEHPNCVHVHDLGEVEGMYFLVMEYVHGCALSQFMQVLAQRELKLSVPLAVTIAAKVAGGLHAAHELTDDAGEPLGVVHRDVSPQNVLVAYKGHVKLIDFGIAKARGRMQQTAAGLLKGKFRYMAPEQAMGKPVDRRTDVYALGVVLWELLTMRKLFDADNELALLDLVRNPRIPPPSSIAPDVPPALDQVVLTALAADQNQRYATCMHFRKALQQVIPESLGIDAPQLSSLLTTVMADVIQEENETLPESAVGTAAKLAKSNLAAVSEFTVTLSGVLQGDITPPPLSSDVLEAAEEPEDQTGEISISDAIGGAPSMNSGLTPVGVNEGDYPATVMLEDMTPPPELQAAAEKLGLGAPAPSPHPMGHNQVHPPHVTGSMPAQSGSKSLMVILIVAVLILAGAVGSLFVWRPWEAPVQPAVAEVPAQAPVVTPAVPDAAPTVVADETPPEAEVQDELPVVDETPEAAPEVEERTAERIPDRPSRGSRGRRGSSMSQEMEAAAMPAAMRSTTVDMTMILTGPVF